MAANRSATSPGIVSVYASGDTWAAASPTAQGTCFYLKQVAGEDTCTSWPTERARVNVALGATETQW